MSLKFSSRVLIICIFAVSALLVGFSPELQQNQAGSWSTPQRIPNYNDLLNAPQMVADQDGTAHAFNLEADDDNRFAIVYRQWSLEQGWTSPVDIILPAYLGVAPSLLDVIIDGQGTFHLIYFGGSQESGSVYYTNALAAEAQDASAWSDPVPIVDDAGPLQAAELIEAENSQIVVVYSGQLFGGGLYEVHTQPNKFEWSEPTLVFRSTNSDNWPNAIRTVRVPDEGIHVVWHLDNTEGLAEETWYGHLSEDLGTWDKIQRLSQRDDDLEFNGHPTITYDGDNLITVFYDDFPPTRFMRRSFDGGETWTQPVRLFKHQGGYGHAAIVKDSNGVLHMLLGNRLQNPEIHGMWYSRWTKSAWLPLVPIVSGPPIGEFSPTRPEAVVVQGNVLLVAWSNDVRREFRTGSWYSYRRLEAPALPVEELPLRQPTPMITLTPESTPEIIGTVTTMAEVVDSASQGNASPRAFLGANPGDYIFLGVSPVLLIVGYLAYRRYKSGKNE